MALIAGATIGAGVLGAGSSLMGSGKASSAAKDAANQAQQRYMQTRADLQPFAGIGQTAAGNALSLAQGSPTGGGPDYLAMAQQNLPPQMTQAQLEQTPGYQWNLAQGLKATQATAAARGLGVSGASLKGAATYATGLADSTYKNQFDMAQQRFGDILNLNTGQQGNLTNQFNRYNALAGTGESAAAGTGTIGASLANTSANYTNAAGVDQATGLSNAGNRLAGGVNNYLGYNAYQNSLGNAAPGTPGISASGNPVMTGFAPARDIGSPGNYIPPTLGGATTGY